MSWGWGGSVLFVWAHAQIRGQPPLHGAGSCYENEAQSLLIRGDAYGCCCCPGVAASVHMAESRCKSLDVFIVPVQLIGCWVKCDKYTVCCISGSNMCAHTHTKQLTRVQVYS